SPAATRRRCLRACAAAMRRSRPGGSSGRTPWCSQTAPRRHDRPDMRVGIATDHGGFDLKEELHARLREAGHEVVDFGAHVLDANDDYPDFVVPLADAVVAGWVERGVAVCGSGVGVCLGVNKVLGVRPA